MQYFSMEASAQESRNHVLTEPKQRNSKQDKVADCGTDFFPESLPSYTEEMESAVRMYGQNEDVRTERIWGEASFLMCFLLKM